MRDVLRAGLIAGVVIALLLTLQCARWTECRRLHPWWYCLID